MGDQQPTQNERDQMLFDSYKMVHEQFKVQNEQYFKRVHALMMVGEIALAGFAANIVRNALSAGVDTNTYALLAGLAQVGVLLAILWYILGCRQMQYMEISRKEMRAIEYALRDRIFPMILAERWIYAGRHSTREDGDIWGQLETADTDSGLRFEPNGEHPRVRFEAIGEEYPIDEAIGEEDPIGNDRGGAEHRPWFAKGRTAGLEVQMSFLFLLGWLFVEAVALIHFGNNGKRFFFLAFLLMLAASLLLLWRLRRHKSYEKRGHYVVGFLFACLVGGLLILELAPWQRGAVKNGLVAPPITLAVNDLGNAISFYRDKLGLPQPRSPKGTAFFQVGDQMIALCRRDVLRGDVGPAASVDELPSLVLTHRVASESEVRNALARAEEGGATVVKPAGDRPSGGYHGYFKDADGHLWEVIWPGTD